MKVDYRERDSLLKVHDVDGIGLTFFMNFVSTEIFKHLRADMLEQIVWTRRRDW